MSYLLLVGARQGQGTAQPNLSKWEIIGVIMVAFRVNQDENFGGSIGS
jgi:hypothetical protein